MRKIAIKVAKSDLAYACKKQLLKTYQEIFANEITRVKLDKHKVNDKDKVNKLETDEKHTVEYYLPIPLSYFDNLPVGTKFLYGFSFTPVTIIKLAKAGLLPNQDSIDAAGLAVGGTLYLRVICIPGRKAVAKN